MLESGPCTQYTFLRSIVNPYPTGELNLVFTTSFSAHLLLFSTDPFNWETVTEVIFLFFQLNKC